MPWELDYALLTFTQLKKSKYYLDNKDTIEIHPVLNLSSYLVDWDKSQLPKQLLIDRFNQYLKLLKDYKVTAEIHEGDYLYGHLDHQRETISSEVDFYISICPDMYFSEHLLPLLISSSKQVDTKYFLITPEIYKMWDNTWDEITNYDYLNVPYDEWDKGDIFDIRANTKSSNKNVTLETTTNIPKFDNRAQGGPVQAGKPYIVGEKGPEVIIPKSDGNVLANDDSQIFAMLLASNPQLQNVSRQRAEKILRSRFPEYFEV